MPSVRISPIRLGLGSALFLAAFAVFVVRPSIALAHHVDLAYTTTCDAYFVEADYIGGDEPRYAQIYVDGALSQTTNFPADTEVADNFFTLSGALPVNTTVEVRMYRAQPGPDALEDIDSVTINAAMTCASTSTPQATSTSTIVPETSTPTATYTATATDTPEPPSATPTTGTQGSVTPLPTDTPHASTETPQGPSSTPTSPASTSTPDATNTPSESESATSTPTLVTTVEALQPPSGPDAPGTTGEPPLETASGLPSTGAGSQGVQGLVLGLAAIVFAAGGLAVAGSGVRRATD